MARLFPHSRARRDAKKGGQFQPVADPAPNGGEDDECRASRRETALPEVSTDQANDFSARLKDGGFALGGADPDSARDLPCVNWCRVNAMDPTANTTTAHHLGRNEPCHCGSGRKYKHCCLDKDEAAARAASAEAAQTTPAANAENAAPVRPPKHQTQQPWKKSAANTHGFHRVSTPRKVGGG